MPYRYEYVEPELFVEHRGKKVYRAYKDMDIDEPLENWYTTSTTDEEEFEFDVRQFMEMDGFQSLTDHAAIIRLAIDKNYLEFPSDD